MKKILVLVVLIAIVFAVPQLRQRAGAAMVPVLTRLGPVGETLVTPIHEFEARNQMKFFLRILGNDFTENRGVPDERGFSQWITRRMPQESPRDPWGNPYWLQREGRTFTVGSNGRDGQRGTADDLIQTASF